MAEKLKPIMKKQLMKYEAFVIAKIMHSNFCQHVSHIYLRISSHDIIIIKLNSMHALNGKKDLHTISYLSRFSNFITWK